MSYSRLKIIENHKGEIHNIDCTDPDDVYALLQSFVGRTIHVEAFKKQVSRMEWQTLWKEDVQTNMTTMGLDEWIELQERLTDGE